MERAAAKGQAQGSVLPLLPPPPPMENLLEKSCGFQIFALACSKVSPMPGPACLPFSRSAFRPGLSPCTSLCAPRLWAPPLLSLCSLAWSMGSSGSMFREEGVWGPCTCWTYRVSLTL